MTLFVNTPGTLLCIAPLALLPIFPGQIIWLILTAGSLCLAAFLMWDLVSARAPVFSASIIGFLLLNCQVVIAAGNTAAIVVGFCIIATWCFVHDRFVVAGVLMMAVSLAIKPHDSGLVLFCFILAGARYRKLALQSVAVTAVIYFVAVVWLFAVAPNWLHDWQSNLATISAPGAMNDPRPASTASVVGAATVISLQGVFSIFSSKEGFYNAASYLVCGLILLPWAIALLFRRNSQARIWFALAVVAPLTMLITYHRVYDSKLLLICVPAAAMLWSRRGAIGRAALIVTSVGVVFSADLPLAALGILLKQLQFNLNTSSGQILTALLERPSQLALLLMTMFFLWIYLRKDSTLDSAITQSETTLLKENSGLSNHARV